MFFRFFISILAVMTITQFSLAQRGPSNNGRLQQVSADDLNYNYSNRVQEWVGCIQSGSNDCRECLYPIDEASARLAEPFTNRCLPSTELLQAVIFHPELPGTDRVYRDAAICECLSGNRGSSLETHSYGRPEAAASIPSDENNAFTEISQNELRSSRLLKTMSAMNYIRDPADAISLAVPYGEVNIGQNSRDQAVNSNLASGLATTSAGGSLQTVIAQVGLKMIADETISNLSSGVNREQLSETDVNGMASGAGSCIPYRHFYASAQYPTDQEFYDDLDQLQARRFNPEDWNYESIVISLKQLVSSRGGLDRAKSSREYQRKVARMKYLHNNPVLKDIFLADGAHATVKEAVFNQIKRIPRPTCTPRGCTRNANWAGSLETYRREMADILADPPATAAAGNGNQISNDIILTRARREARLRLRTSDTVIGIANVNDAARWGEYCRNSAQFLAEPEERTFMEDIEGSFGRRSYPVTRNDGEYMKINESLCGTPRRARDGGPEVSFYQYKRNRCPVMDQGDCADANGARLLADFFTAYPVSTQIEENENVNLLAPFLGGRVALSIAGSTETATLNRASLDPGSRSRPVVFRSREYAPLTSGDRSATARVAAVTPARVTPSGSAVSQNSQQQSSQAFVPTSSEGVIVPQQISGTAVSQTETSPESNRQNLTEGTSEERRLQEEIASLRELVRNPPPDLPRNSPFISNLNRQIADLNKKLEEQVSANETYRRRESEDSEDSEEESRERVASRNSSADRTRRPATGASGIQQNGVQQAAVSGGASGGGLSAPAGSLGAPSLSSSGTSSSASRRISTLNNELLSINGVREGSEGAVTVEQAGGATRGPASASSEGIIPLTVSAEEFNVISSDRASLIARYSQELSQAPEGVSVINLRDSENRLLEVLIEKRGNDITLFQGERLRQWTLEYLTTESRRLLTE